MHSFVSMSIWFVCVSDQPAYGEVSLQNFGFIEGDQQIFDINIRVDTERLCTIESLTHIKNDS